MFGCSQLTDLTRLEYICPIKGNTVFTVTGKAIDALGDPSGPLWQGGRLILFRLPPSPDWETIEVYGSLKKPTAPLNFATADVIIFFANYNIDPNVSIVVIELPIGRARYWDATSSSESDTFVFWEGYKPKTLKESNKVLPTTFTISIGS